MLIFAAAFVLCPATGVRADCVVDGDTAWFGREKVRIEGIDTPETDHAKCPAERVLGERAKHRLLSLLRAGEPRVERTGADRYGRTLAWVTVNGRDVGAILVSENLARPYAGGRRPWC